MLPIIFILFLLWKPEVTILFDLIIAAYVSSQVRVITEKPMTTEVEKCRAVNRACKSIGKHITVSADAF